MLIAAHFLQRLWMGQKIGRLNQGQENAVPSPSSRPDFTRVMSSLESEGVDIGVNRATRGLIASGVIGFVCVVLAVVLSRTFSIGVAGLLGWLFFFAAVAHLVFGIHFGSGTLAWHAFIAALDGLGAIHP